MSASDENSSKPDAELESLLSSGTLKRASSEPELLLSQLRFVSDLLGELPEPPVHASLIFRRKDGKVQAQPIAGGLTVGRGDECEISFPGMREMSRRHFQIVREERLYLLIDAGSANGTFVRGTVSRIAKRELRDGDIIDAGGFVFVFLQGKDELPLE